MFGCALALCGNVGSWPCQALAQARTGPRGESLATRLAVLLREAKLGGQVGVAVASGSNGRMLFEHRAELPLNPASNMKLVTAAAVLEELGPSFRIRTGLYGRNKNDAVVGGLYLKSYGDPTLRVADIAHLAGQIVGSGVRTVDEVRVDGSYFDSITLPPAFEQQPDEAAAFRAPIAAVSVERNSYALRVSPGRSAGDPAQVKLKIADYFELRNELTTGSTGSLSVIAIQQPKADKLSLLVRGRVPLRLSNASFRRRVAHPLRYAGHALIQSLRAQRVRVPQRIVLRPLPTDLPLLATRLSPPLGQILWAMGKQSDNFTAEMLLKLLGAERKRLPGRSQDGASVLVAFLEQIGVPKGRATIVNGSGLFRGNKLAARDLVRLLLYVYGSPALRAEYLAHLAVGGKDGTLARRLQGLPADAIVRAKTGTLNDVIALSGYVLGPSPSRTIAFSFLANGVNGRRQQARDLADRLVAAMASELDPSANAAARTQEEGRPVSSGRDSPVAR